MTLLLSLLRSIEFESIVTIDHRMIITENISNKINLIRVRPTIFHRLISEIKLLICVSGADIVFRFGSLPPLFKLRCYTILFIQNRYLLESIDISSLRMKDRFRIFVERIWLNFRIGVVDEFIVQTPSMKLLLEKKISKKKSVRVLPLVDDISLCTLEQVKRVESASYLYDFTYVASGEAHKNHKTLIQAWILLAKDGLYPTLCLTLDKFDFLELCKFIDSNCECFDLKIINLGSLKHADILQLYKNSRALIYASKFESFGLPLIEAKHAGLPILASELDYVRDIIDPLDVFNPDSPISIARCVRRFIHQNEPKLLIMNGKQFLSALFD